MKRTLCLMLALLMLSAGLSVQAESGEWTFVSRN